MKKMFITGGAGFIGSNAAYYFYKKKWQVYIFDNLSRKGALYNIKRLKKETSVRFIKGDIRKFNELSKILSNINPDVILHCAGQVAVTTSFLNPREDFEINAFGNLNVLESIRINKLNSIVIYTSTNKVYGNLDSSKVKINKNRYVYKNNIKGIDEENKTDFHSPYGCSTGAAKTDAHAQYYYELWLRITTI